MSLTLLPKEMTKLRLVTKDDKHVMEAQLQFIDHAIPDVITFKDHPYILVRRADNCLIYREAVHVVIR